MGEQNFEVRIIDTAFNYFNMKLFTVSVIALLSMAAAVPAPESPSYSRMRRSGQPSADSASSGSASSGSPSSGSPSSGASSPSTPKQKKKPKNKPNKKPNNKPKKQNKKPKTPKTPSPVSPKTPAPVLMNSPVDQAMSLSDMEKFNKNINTKAIIGHGCHCSKYSRTDMLVDPQLTNLTLLVLIGTEKLNVSASQVEPVIKKALILKCSRYNSRLTVSFPPILLLAVRLLRTSANMHSV